MNLQSLNEAIKDFNQWNGPAWLYYNKKEDYFEVEVFANDVQQAQTVLSEDCFVVIGKGERDNISIDENRKQYIMELMDLIEEGYEVHQAKYQLLEKYPNF